jgi:hypothetical protein
VPPGVPRLAPAAAATSRCTLRAVSIQVNVSGQHCAVEDLRMRVTLDEREVIVCGGHEDWVQHQYRRMFTSRPVLPGPDGPLACAPCSAGIDFDAAPLDHRGRPMCAEVFMMGLHCTLDPDHSGVHEFICRDCDANLYDQICRCP